MNKEELQKEKKNIERDLYLRQVALGEITDTLTGYPNIDKPWLKYYSEEQIKTMPVEKTAYQYLYDENKNFEHDIAVIYLGKKIKYYQLFEEINKVENR